MIMLSLKYFLKTKFYANIIFAANKAYYPDWERFN